MPQEGDAQHKAHMMNNPIGVVSLFVGFCETMVGIAATQMSGWVQGLMAISAVALPVSVFICFFVMLWKRPWHLYAPSDYPRNVTVAAFVKAFRRAPDVNRELLADALRTALESALPATIPAPLAPAAVEQIVEDAVGVAQTELSQRILCVDASEVHPGLRPVEFPVTDGATVDSLLDVIWGVLQYWIPPDTYARNWILVDKDSEVPLRMVGPKWAKSQGMKRDDRLLAEAGIAAGSKLAVRLMVRQRFRHFLRDDAHNETPWGPGVRDFQ